MATSSRAIPINIGQAAVDNWGNESAWSNARVLGLPMTSAPAVPISLAAELLRNDLPDLSMTAPGFGVGIIDKVTLARTIGSGQILVPRTGVPEIVQLAKTSKIQMGVSLSVFDKSSADSVPATLSALFGNLPDTDDIHTIVAIGYDQLRPDKKRAGQLERLQRQRTGRLSRSIGPRLTMPRPMNCRP